MFTGISMSCNRSNFLARAASAIPKLNYKQNVYFFSISNRFLKHTAAIFCLSSRAAFIAA